MLQGYLTKRGSLVKSWLRRWIVLEDGTLSYFADKDTKKAKGFVVVSGAMIERVPEETFKRGNVFLVRSVNGEELYLQADGAADAADWYAALSKAAAKAVSYSGSLSQQAGLRKKWKERYYVLAGPQLSWFDSEASARAPGGGKANGNVMLWFPGAATPGAVQLASTAGALVAGVDDELMARVIVVAPATAAAEKGADTPEVSSAGTRSLLLLAPTATDAVSWLEKLTASVNGALAPAPVPGVQEVDDSENGDSLRAPSPLPVSFDAEFFPAQGNSASASTPALDLDALRETIRLEERAVIMASVRAEQEAERVRLEHETVQNRASAAEAARQSALASLLHQEDPPPQVRAVDSSDGGSGVVVGPKPPKAARHMTSTSVSASGAEVVLEPSMKVEMAKALFGGTPGNSTSLGSRRGSRDHYNDARAEIEAQRAMQQQTEYEGWGLTGRRGERRGGDEEDDLPQLDGKVKGAADQLLSPPKVAAGVIRGGKRWKPAQSTNFAAGSASAASDLASSISQDIDGESIVEGEDAQADLPGSVSEETREVQDIAAGDAEVSHSRSAELLAIGHHDEAQPEVQDSLHSQLRQSSAACSGKPEETVKMIELHEDSQSTQNRHILPTLSEPAGLVVHTLPVEAGVSPIGTWRSTVDGPERSSMRARIGEYLLRRTPAAAQGGPSSPAGVYILTRLAVEVEQSLYDNAYGAQDVYMDTATLKARLKLAITAKSQGADADKGEVQSIVSPPHLPQKPVATVEHSPSTPVAKDRAVDLSAKHEQQALRSKEAGDDELKEGIDDDFQGSVARLRRGQVADVSRSRSVQKQRPSDSKEATPARVRAQSPEPVTRASTRWGAVPHPSSVVVRHYPSQAEDGGLHLKLVLDRRPEEPPHLPTLNKWQYRCCADCGVTQTTGMFGTKARYCWYTELLYCTACMGAGDNEGNAPGRGSMRPLPWRVVHTLDDTPFPVCKAAADFIDSVWDLPLVALSAIAPGTVIGSPSLQRTAALRAGLFDLRESMASLAAELHDEILEGGGDRLLSESQSNKGSQFLSEVTCRSAALAASNPFAALALALTKTLLQAALGRTLSFLGDNLELLPLSLIVPAASAQGGSRIVARLTDATRRVQTVLSSLEDGSMTTQDLIRNAAEAGVDVPIVLGVSRDFIARRVNARAVANARSGLSPVVQRRTTNGSGGEQ